MALKDLTLELTQKCPMDCKLCSSNGGKPCTPEFSFEELKRIINQAKELGVIEVSLSGGEPFTCPFLGDLCKYTTDLDIEVFIFTSGNYYDEFGRISSIPVDKFKELNNCGVKKIVFSLHGSNADIHERMTRKKGSYDNLLQSIKNAQKVGLGLEVHVVPVKDNYKDIPAIENLLNVIGVKSLHILRFVPQGRGEIYRNELELTDIELSSLKETLQNLITNSRINITVGAHFNSLQLSSGYCTAGVSKAAIRPDGYVFPCVGMKNIDFLIDFNNIRDYSLDLIMSKSSGFMLSKRMVKPLKAKSNDRNDLNLTSICLAQCYNKKREIIKLDQRKLLAEKGDSSISPVQKNEIII